MSTPVQQWNYPGAGGYHTERILVTVKAYPNPSKKYTETVCVAGITEAREWIRLYPIQYRMLAYEEQFPTYGWIDVAVKRNSADFRPESYKIDPDSLRVGDILKPARDWAARKQIILPLVDPSMEVLAALGAQKRRSLGLIRPREVRRLIITKDEEQWTLQQLASLRQRTWMETLSTQGGLREVQELEKIPYRFSYEFLCDDATCKGHTYTIFSWEVMQAFRNFRAQYGPDGWEAKFRQRFEQEFLTRKDLHLYVGTIRSHPQIWSIIGLFYPPRTELRKTGSRWQQLPLLE